MPRVSDEQLIFHLLIREELPARDTIISTSSTIKYLHTLTTKNKNCELRNWQFGERNKCLGGNRAQNNNREAALGSNLKY
uniref:Uncharacterized protein n=1 Tax=Rhizophora mucronata TaxID=61149 RepID=A0A2P2JVB6_RHIMU